MPSRKPAGPGDRIIRITLGREYLADIDKVIAKAPYPATRSGVIRVALRKFLDAALGYKVTRGAGT